MEDNKIIGFNLSLNFGFANDCKRRNEIVNNIEDIIDEALKVNQDTGAILLSGKAEFIKEDNNLGIRKVEK